MTEDLLRTQSLARPLTAREVELAAALERIYTGGAVDFAVVAAQLTEGGIEAPSDGSTTWTEERLERELAAINRSLDEDYAAHGRGA